MIALHNFFDYHRVNGLYVFGSILSNKFNASSDIDILIQFNPIDVLEYFDNYMDLKEKLELHYSVLLIWLKIKL